MLSANDEGSYLVNGTSNIYTEMENLIENLFSNVGKSPESANQRRELSPNTRQQQGLDTGSLDSKRPWEIQQLHHQRHSGAQTVTHHGESQYVIKCQELTIENETLKTNLMKAIETVEHTRDHLDDYDNTMKENQQLKDEIEEVKTNLNKRIADVSILEQKLDTQKNHCEAAHVSKEVIDTKDKEIPKFSQELEASHKAMLDLQMEKENYKTTVEKIEQKIKELTDENNNLQQKLHLQKTRDASLDLFDDLQKEQNRHKTLQEEIQTKKIGNAEFSKQLKNLGEENQVLVKKIDKAKLEGVQLNLKLDEQKNKLSQLKELEAKLKQETNAARIQSEDFYKDFEQEILKKENIYKNLRDLNENESSFTSVINFDNRLTENFHVDENLDNDAIFSSIRIGKPAHETEAGEIKNSTRAAENDREELLNHIKERLNKSIKEKESIAEKIKEYLQKSPQIKM